MLLGILVSLLLGIDAGWMHIIVDGVNLLIDSTS